MPILDVALSGAPSPERSAAVAAALAELTADILRKDRRLTSVAIRYAAPEGELHDASYVHVHSVPAEDWGYGGRTQAQRRAAATPIAA
jgi:phenylpyruvate tautomerase PptA (4-oxalocrotonate tautomerase family)